MKKYLIKAYNVDLRAQKNATVNEVEEVIRIKTLHNSTYITFSFVFSTNGQRMSILAWSLLFK